MGCGKNTIGHALAKAFSFSFLDTDKMITAQTGRSIAQIFDDGGKTGRLPEEKAGKSRLPSIKNRLAAYEKHAAYTRSNAGTVDKTIARVASWIQESGRIPFLLEK